MASVWDMSENGVLSCDLKDGLDDGEDDSLRYLDLLREKLGKPGVLRALQVRRRSEGTAAPPS